MVSKVARGNIIKYIILELNFIKKKLNVYLNTVKTRVVKLSLRKKNIEFLTIQVQEKVKIFQSQKIDKILKMTDESLISLDLHIISKVI